ncbi:GbsR/MarR family transcriptional regulator [Spirillospora sp. NPDC048911]|uniref:GbsR/MarR family transcriptional regulator n=1 Tax=Spirillospora sp. NPDC048911 TaxID=3364527 RepID=UPI0037180343
MTDPTPSASNTAPDAVRDDEVVLRFIERFTSVLAESGWPRMPARVFVALMVTDSGALTAAELAQMLQVSPAAVSGAVRYLTRFHLAIREREPGSRRDIFRVRDDAWQDALASRDALLAQYSSSFAEGADVVGPESAAGRRLTEATEFFEFVRKELDGLMDRWRAHQDAVATGDPRD